MNYSGKSIIVLVLLLVMTAPSPAGTRLFRELHEVLRMPGDYVVFSAELLESEYSHREAADVMTYRVNNVTLLWDEVKIGVVPEKIQFSAYRPVPSSNHKNRSVYSDGSGLEFSIKKGQRYIFICSNASSVLRIEPLKNHARVLELLKKYSARG